VLKLLDRENKRVHIIFRHDLDGLADNQPEQHLRQLIQTADVSLGHILHHGATARQDINQVTALENQQGLAHGAATDLQLASNTQFLNPVTGQHLATNDLSGQMLGDLFGQTFLSLEAHRQPLMSDNPFRTVRL